MSSAFPPRRVAVVGSGIAGLSAAWHLRRAAQVTLFEAGAQLGGHAHTVDVQVAGRRFGVDTGFLVCNHRTYPGLMGLFRELGVALAASDMGFSVQVRGAGKAGGLEWSGTGLAGVFAQRRNLARPAFWGMLADILRFNHLATALARAGADARLHESTGDFLARQGFGAAFRDHYLIPMVACIWSCSPRQMMDFPLGTLVRFLHNHGLLQVVGQPQWYTVSGGSRTYVERIAAQLPEVRRSCPVQGVRTVPGGVVLASPRGHEHFDAVIVATHSDQALRLLGETASPAQRAVLGAIAYQSNDAVLHTDTAQMPTRRAAWAAWNHETDGGTGAPRVCLHYWLNALQPLPVDTPVMVSLNPLRAPDPRRVLGRFEYAHPVFDAAAVAAQARLPELDAESARMRLWFAGAWRGFGFHEDGFQAGARAAAAVLAQQATSSPWPDAA